MLWKRGEKLLFLYKNQSSVCHSVPGIDSLPLSSPQPSYHKHTLYTSAANLSPSFFSSSISIISSHHLNTMDAPYCLYSTTTSAAAATTKASSNDDDYCYSLQLPADMAALLSNYNRVDNHQLNINHDDSNNYYYNYSYADDPCHFSPPGTGAIPSPPPPSWEAASGGGGQVMFCPSEGGGRSGSSSVSDAASAAEEEGGGMMMMRARIAAHPLYPKLLQAYIDCHKVGAPAEMSSILDEMQTQIMSSSSTSRLGADPELDDFMESYYEVLVKYKWEMWRPFDEATAFLTDIQSQFHALCGPPPAFTAPPPLHPPDQQKVVINNNGNMNAGGGGGGGGSGSSDEDMSSGEADHLGSSSAAGRNDSRGQRLMISEEDRELKDRLMHKYGGYLSSLKQEFSKKKKKGKLPKEGRLILLNWWNLHYKWPYPTEADKVALAESTGLDQKQINNWFINQRKRHWKPTDNMQSSVIDSLYSTDPPFFISDYHH
ncbi:unnamed protein product [Linum tenue]|uniref:Uncharacterized protein n=1 Tax=Linum tenue TaxID=586396 RepID=A0AAV0INE0_9ROSI|nr:unnamed protein product [Linum tenue]